MDVVPLATVLSFMVFAGVYLFWLNRVMLQQPRTALDLSPTRYSTEKIRAAVEEFERNPPDIRSSLPPATGRRYIVFGGAGFLGGWIVLQLLERGEDPRLIRVFDIQPPTRLDLLDAQARGVEFIQGDVGNRQDVFSALARTWRQKESTPLTIFHTASNIRFFERHARQLPASERVNVDGTRHIIDAAHSVGASILVYTSSGSICIKPARFWLWPWESEPTNFVNLVNDETPVPATHSSAWSNYGFSKTRAEQIVRAADLSSGEDGTILRTSCLRPGNGVYGPGGDVLCGAFLVRRTNPSWILSIIQSFCYVENCALAHLQLERGIISKPEEVGGDAFCISDPNPPITYGDVGLLENVLTDGKTTFPHFPPVLMLIIAQFVEAYTLARILFPLLTRLLPPVKGDIVNLQPSLFSLTSAHLIFDDSRARRVFGYSSPFTTLQGLCKLVHEFKESGGRAEFRQMLPGGGGVGFGLAAAQRGVAKSASSVMAGPGTPRTD